MEIIDFEVKGNTIRFYLGKNGKQYGDDWDDKPYEHNAGRVYDEFISDYADVYVDFSNVVLQPSDDYSGNSPYCKDDMVARKVPCVVVVPQALKNPYDDGEFKEWVGVDGVVKFYFGDQL